jgi:ABC-2 type transport system permease protein
VSGPLATIKELFGAELLKLRTTRTTLVLAIAALVVVSAADILILALVSVTDLADSETFAGLTYPGAIVGLLMIIAGIIGMAGEFRHGTITYTFLAAPHRERVVALKLVFYFLVGAVAAIVTLIYIQVLIAIILPIRGGDIVTVSSDQWGYFGRVILTTGLFGAAGVALGALLRSQVLAVTVALSWVVVEQMILSPVLILTEHARIAMWLPLQIFQQVTGSPFDNGDTTTAEYLMSPTRALIIGVSYIVLAAVASLLTTMRRDVT